MNENKAVVVSGDVQGNITSCGIEQQIKSIEVNHALSLSGKVTYITYDVCNKDILAEYTRPEPTELGWALIIVLSIVAVFVGIGVALK